MWQAPRNFHKSYILSFMDQISNGLYKFRFKVLKLQNGSSLSLQEPPLAQPPQTCTTATTTTTTTTTKPTTTTTTTTTTTQQTQVCGEPMWIGDGNCDDENNFEECDYDDGDCCTDKLHLHCKKCECKEPQVCPRPYWVGDGNCDDENNIAACNFDDNDCCEDTNHNYCKECKCIRF